MCCKGIGLLAVAAWGQVDGGSGGFANCCKIEVHVLFRYTQTADNDLQYWGLDYPPLSAYQVNDGLAILICSLAVVRSAGSRCQLV